MTPEATPLQMYKKRNERFESSFLLANQLKEKYFHSQPHRALAHLTMGPYLLTQIIGLPLLFFYLINSVQPYLVLFWDRYLMFWAGVLDIPLRVNAQNQQLNELQIIFENNSGVTLPGTFTWLSIAIITLFLFFISFTLNKEKLPLKYLLRILCVIQFTTLAYFWLMPAQFPYSVTDHLRDLAHSGQALLFAIPLMMTMGYYILQTSLAAKILHTLMILTFFFLMIPHQIVLHAFLLQHLSVLIMPLLYICFSGVFNVFVFIALYSWVASTIPSSKAENDISV